VSETHWTSSIANPGTFSVGPYVRPFETPFGHVLLSRDCSSEDIGVGAIKGLVTTGEYELSFESQHDEGNEALRRLVAYFLVTVMPTEGLDEGLTSLRDIFEYHDENQRFAVPEMPDTQEHHGVVVSYEERAPFVIGS